MARLVAQGMSPLLGQNMIIDNRPIGVIQAQIAAGAPPNGYTLLSCSNVLWIEPLMKETPYDAVRDFVPITLTSRSTLVLTVHPSLPIENVKELIAYAKARPGEAQLCDRRFGHGLSPRGGAFQIDGGRELRSHLVQGRGAGDD